MNHTVGIKVRWIPFFQASSGFALPVKGLDGVGRFSAMTRSSPSARNIDTFLPFCAAVRANTFAVAANSRCTAVGGFRSEFANSKRASGPQVWRYTHHERQATLTGGLRDEEFSASTSAVVVNIAAIASTHYYRALQELILSQAKGKSIIRRSNLALTWGYSVSFPGLGEGKIQSPIGVRRTPTRCESVTESDWFILSSSVHLRCS
jgi:hypothetical protein